MIVPSAASLLLFEVRPGTTMFKKTGEAVLIDDKTCAYIDGRVAYLTPKTFKKLLKKLGKK